MWPGTDCETSTTSFIREREGGQGGRGVRCPRRVSAIRGSAVVSRAFDGINRSNFHLFQRVVLTPVYRRRPVPSPGGEGRVSEILYSPCNRKKNRG